MNAVKAAEVAAQVQGVALFERAAIPCFCVGHSSGQFGEVMAFVVPTIGCFPALLELRGGVDEGVGVVDADDLRAVTALNISVWEKPWWEGSGMPREAVAVSSLESPPVEGGA